MAGRAGSPLPAAQRECDVGPSANARRRAADCPPYLCRPIHDWRIPRLGGANPGAALISSSQSPARVVPCARGTPPNSSPSLPGRPATAMRLALEAKWAAARPGPCQKQPRRARHHCQRRNSLPVHVPNITSCCLRANGFCAAPHAAGSCRALSPAPLSAGQKSGFEKQSPLEVGTARRAVRGRLGEATLPKPGLRPSWGF